MTTVVLLVLFAWLFPVPLLARLLWLSERGGLGGSWLFAMLWPLWPLALVRAVPIWLRGARTAFAGVLFDLALGAVAFRRLPDVTIGSFADPYLERWWVIPRNPVFNVYLHRVMRSDDDRALHDHPWFNLSLILKGRYAEHTISAGGVHRRTIRRAGDLKARSPWAAHRLELLGEGEARECWTLFLTGPRMRGWGFHCPNGWRPWREFVANAPGVSTIGRGCGEDA